MIDYSLIKIIPSADSHSEFSYRVKKAAMGDYIARIWGWGEKEKVQREFHTREWREKRPQIILYNDKPIGTIRTSKNEGYLEIEQFYLMPEYHNKGIGSHLLKQILDDADNSGLVAKLAVLKINPAISLYRRHGFENVRKDEIFYFMERKPGKAERQ